MVTVLRMGGNGIQSSFYVVYLGDIGYSGTLIGVLLGAAGVLGFAGALSVEPLTRLMQPYWLLIVTVASTILFVAATPLISGIFVLLLAASALRGGAMGLSQPLMISILARAAGDKKQGKGAGLRTTANRLSSMLVPVVMGGVVEAFGIEASFYIIGAILIGLMGLVALHVSRTLRA
jgi:predicted MFS family arabinose efflux permease